MLTSEIIGYVCAVAMGITLGLVGGGGSILTIPILVYLFHINAKLATTYSLFIVGCTSAIGAFTHFRLGNIQLKPAMQFAIPSLASILLVRKFLLPLLPDTIFTIGHFAVSKEILIMVVFAGFMLAASYFMIKPSQPVAATKTPNGCRVMLIGALVGMVTGFLGAGGGFLIIPALLFFTNISMKQAVGTSLLIIAFNSLLGFIGDVVMKVVIDYLFIFQIVALAVLGIIIGTQLSKKINGAKLKPAFGWFVLVMGIYIITKEMFF